MERNRGVITLRFFDGRQVTANVKTGNASFGINTEPSITVTMFTNDIDKTVVYNLFEVEDVS